MTRDRYRYRLRKKIFADITTALLAKRVVKGPSSAAAKSIADIPLGRGRIAAGVATSSSTVERGTTSLLAIPSLSGTLWRTVWQPVELRHSILSWQMLSKDKSLARCASQFAWAASFEATQVPITRVRMAMMTLVRPLGQCCLICEQKRCIFDHGVGVLAGVGAASFAAAAGTGGSSSSSLSPDKVPSVEMLSPSGGEAGVFVGGES